MLCITGQTQYINITWYGIIFYMIKQARSPPPHKKRKKKETESQNVKMKRNKIFKKEQHYALYTALLFRANIT